MKLRELKLKPQGIMNLLITIEQDKRMKPQITEWNMNTTEASGEDPSNLAPEGHWITSHHREYAEQGDEDGWS